MDGTSVTFDEGDAQGFTSFIPEGAIRNSLGVVSYLGVPDGEGVGVMLGVREGVGERDIPIGQRE